MDWKNAMTAVKAGSPGSGEVHRLTSRWGTEVTDDHVLQEYPRPQLRRANYQILNGRWECTICREGEETPCYAGEILVPFSPESPLSGVEHLLQPGELLTYRRTLTVEEDHPGQRLLLHFDGVDQRCTLLMNDQEVGSHVGGYLPFFFDVTDYILPGDNNLTLYVWDDTEQSGLSRGKQSRTPGGMFYTAHSGIWQTVWTEWVPEVYITSLHITPDYDNAAVKVEWQLSKGASAMAAAYVVVAGKPVASWQGSVDRAWMKLENVHPWTPEDPYLYHLYLQAGEDRIESYFAMRTVTAEPDGEGICRLCLNHKPYFQNGVLDQGYWPESLCTPPSDRAMIADIAAAKALGFNLIRKHAKVEPLRWYYHCDRMGMLVWQDMVPGGAVWNTMWMTNLPTVLPWLQTHLSDRRHRRLFGRQDAGLRALWLQTCQETVELLYNSPSVVMWVLFNEGWGQFDTNEAVQRIKQCDPTRLVDAASGWFDQGGGDVKDLHNYFRPLTVPKDRRPVVLGEYGGYACRIQGHSSRERDYGYRTFPDRTALTEGLETLFSQLPKLKGQGLSAAVYTQLTDIEEETNGLLTYDRRVLKYRKKR